MIDPNVHSCGTVYPHGVEELSHPEPGVFLAGVKSCGRAPTFLAMAGYEQVRSIAAALAGDHAAAERVLPDTGVRGGAGIFDAPAEEQEDGCGGPTESQVLSVPTPVKRRAAATTATPHAMPARAHAGEERVPLLSHQRCPPIRRPSGSTVTVRWMVDAVRSMVAS